jgi:2-isopropylmalate synthase
MSGEQLQVVFEEFKKLADKKKEIYDGDISSLCEQEIRGEAGSEWSLVSLEVSSGTGKPPQVKMTLRHGEEEKSAEVTEGDGPIDAAFWAIERITGLELTCKDFQVRSATLGRDALGEVTVEIESKGSTFRGRGASTDTVEATVKAVLDAVNRILFTAESAS